MQQDKLRFVIANDPALDFDLIQEAWIGNRLVADVRQVNSVWMVTFFPEDTVCNLAWDVLVEIYQSFSRFIADQTH